MSLDKIELLYPKNFTTNCFCHIDCTQLLLYRMNFSIPLSEPLHYLTQVFPDLVNQTITPPSMTNLLTPTACGTHTSGDIFSHDLETNYHNAIHVDINGSMTSITTATDAAIF